MKIPNARLETPVETLSHLYHLLKHNMPLVVLPANLANGQYTVCGPNYLNPDWSAIIRVESGMAKEIM